MAESKQSSEEVFVAIHDKVAFLRIRERGSFKISATVKQFGIAAMEQGVERFVLDLHDCVGMDSTFMGIIAGMAFRLRKQSNGEVIVVGLSPRTRSLLSTLGLDQLVKPYMAGSTPEEFQAVLGQGRALEAVDACETDRRGTAEMMLEAHENLVALSPENLPRFKDVLTFLKEDLHKEPLEDR